MFRDCFNFTNQASGDMGSCSNVQKPCILALGHPLLDIQANVCEDFLRKYKVDANGYTLKGPDQEGLYEELMEKKFELTYVSGGSAQNTIKMMQWILEDAESSKCAYLGCIGNDNPGDILLQSMEETGVQTLYEVSENLGTGVCFVLVNGPHRSLITSLGAASAFSANFLRQEMAWDMVKSAYFYYIMVRRIRFYITCFLKKGELV